MTETFITNVIGGGRVTIRRDVRLKEKLKEGDTVRIVITKINPEDLLLTPEEKFYDAKIKAIETEKKKLEKKKLKGGNK